MFTGMGRALVETGGGRIFCALKEGEGRNFHA